MLKNPITGDRIPENWILTKVDDLKSDEKHACVAGPFGSDISSKYFVEKGTPVIRGNNLTLTNDKFRAEGFVFVSPIQAQNYKGQHVKANDLVFTCWGTIGQVGIIPENGPFQEYIISNKQLKLRVDKEKVNPTFLYYYFSTKSMVQYITNIAIGSAVPGINLGLLKKLPVVLPPKYEQDCIAKVSDYFFDLIENNNQRIKLLEEMAAEIYKEWFVRLRFPGYQNCKFFDKDGNEVPHGADGTLPEGWIDGKVGDLVKMKKGKNITQSTITEGNVAVVAGGLKPAYFHNTPNTKSPTITISASGANAGYVNLYYQDIWASDCSFIDSDMTQWLFFFYSTLRVRQKEVYHLQKGSAQPHVYPKDIMSLSIKYPKKELIADFEDLIKPFYEEIGVLRSKNQVLQESRDLLLPRLISGKLKVDNLDSTSKPTMAAEPQHEYKS
jgi:type I restriction enzyme S subunit